MKIKNIFFVILITFLSMGTIFPLFRQGFFDFHDNTQVVRVYEMTKSLSEGEFPVRWVQDLGYGYGYPIFNFYGPLPYYVGGALSLSGFNTLASTKIMIGLGVVLSGITMFFFSRKFFGTMGGILSAVSYAYFPYHAVNVYVRGAVGEYYAFAFLPLIFLGIYSLFEIKKDKKLNANLALPLSIIFGIFLVATSHNLTILMVLIFLFPTILYGLIISKNRKLFAVLSIISVLVGLLLASFYIVPAFLEMSYTNVTSQIGGGANFKDHFICIGQIWQSQWGFGGSIPGCIDGISFAFGKINIILFILSIGFLIFNLLKKKVGHLEKIIILCVFLFLVSIFLMSSISEGLWKSISYMEYLQFPWRFINFSALFLSFTLGYLVYALKKINNNLSLVILLFSVLLIIFAYSKHFYPQSFNDYTSSYFENKEYINYTVSKISDEYMPKNFKKPQSAYEIPNSQFEVIYGQGFVSGVYDKTLESKASYAFIDGGVIHINKAYFPAWKAYVDGEKRDLMASENGMNIKLEKGSGEITLKFEQTFVEILGNIISILSFLTLFAVIMFSKIYGKKTT